MILISELYESPSYDRNEKKYGILDTPQCVCCMKPLTGENIKQIHMNTAGKAVHTSLTEGECFEKTGDGSQGWFEIGNTCAKKMPKGFVL